MGWFQCVKGHCDVMDADVRKKAVESAAKGQLKAYDFLPAENEPEQHGQDIWQDDSESDEEDELDITQPKPEGERKSKRKKLDRQPTIGSYMVDSSQIELSDDESLDVRQ